MVRDEVSVVSRVGANVLSCVAMLRSSCFLASMLAIHKHLIRFSKIAVEGKDPGSKLPRKPLAYQESNMFTSMCNPPS